MALNVQKNQLTSLPASLPPALKRLGAKSNRLEALPDGIGECGELTELFVTDNQLRELPASLCKCSKLVKLQACSRPVCSCERLNGSS